MGGMTIIESVREEITRQRDTGLMLIKSWREAIVETSADVQVLTDLLATLDLATASAPCPRDAASAPSTVVEGFTSSLPVAASTGLDDRPEGAAPFAEPVGKAHGPPRPVVVVDAAGEGPVVVHGPGEEQPLASRLGVLVDLVERCEACFALGLWRYDRLAVLSDDLTAAGLNPWEINAEIGRVLRKKPSAISVARTKALRLAAEAQASPIVKAVEHAALSPLPGVPGVVPFEGAPMVCFDCRFGFTSRIDLSTHTLSEHGRHPTRAEDGRTMREAAAEALS